VKANNQGVAVVVSSCDAYADVWPAFFTLFFRYWPDCPFPVYLIANRARFDHPRVTTLAIDPDRRWATNLRLALERVPCRRVLYFQEDYFLDQPVRTAKIAEWLQYMDARQAGYLRLLAAPGPEMPSADGRSDIGEIPPDSLWRTSLQAAFWDADLLRSLLRDGESGWDMEVKGRARAAVLPGPFLSVRRVPRADRALSYLFTAVVSGLWIREVRPLLRREGIEVDFAARRLETRWEWLRRHFWNMAEWRRPVIRRLRRLLGLAAAAALLVAGCRRAEPVSAESVLQTLTNRIAFCTPAAGVSDMAATFDRSGGNVDWWDIPAPIAGTTDLYEALNVKGPGCLKRIWMTNIPATEWLFYVDGEDTARLRMSQEDLLTIPPADARPLRGNTSGGCYSYMPIPFARSLRIVIRVPAVDQNSRLYFQFQHESYPSGTPVVSWPSGTAAAASNALARVASAWRDVPAEAAAAAGRLAWQRHEVPARQRAVLLDRRGPATVRTLAVRLDTRRLNAVLRSLVLRSLVLECRWDDAAKPSIEVPLGDFFCNGLHPRRFASLAMANVDGAMLCRLPMPFRRQGRIAVRNDGPVDVALEAAAEVDDGGAGDRLYLHGAFHDALSSGAPLTLLRTAGRGKYVGTYLIALGMDGSWNLLEGDEAFYRDGGREPVHHGTGLEDYFNGGWYYYGLFEMPLHGLLEKAAMRTAQYRFHLTDPVTFRKDLRLVWEAGNGMAGSARGYLSAAAYWYQDRPGPSGSAIPPVEQRFPRLERVGLYAIMAELFELERVGLIEEAEERCAFYAGVLAAQPEHAVFRLRGLAYREMRAGYDAVKADYAALAASTNLPPEIAAQARLLHWRGAAPGRAIFGAHGNSTYRLYVDGRLVGEGGDPVSWQGWPVEFAPGPHMLQVELAPGTLPEPFFSAGFSSYHTNIQTDTSWDYACEKPAGWPARADQAGAWKPSEPRWGWLPSMTWWAFAPNAFPCVQSGPQRGGPCSDWNSQPARTVCLRRRVDVPAACGDRPPLPPRLIQLPSGPAVRPPDDRSNEGVTHAPR
jgi:hypothetical protein